MKKSELGAYLAERIENKRLYVSVPELNWSFGSDNADQIETAFTMIRKPVAVIVRKFTNIDSDIPFAANPEKFIPMKIVAGFCVFGENIDIVMLSKKEIKESYSVCAETGEEIKPPSDLVFSGARELLEKIK